jgi:hypothetical protein
MSGFCELNRNMLGRTEKSGELEYSGSGQRQRLWALPYIFGCSWIPASAGMTDSRAGMAGEGFRCVSGAEKRYRMNRFGISSSAFQPRELTS